MGQISSIAPASAAITNGTVFVVDANASVAVGAVATTNFTATTAGTTAAADIIKYRKAVTSATAG